MASSLRKIFEALNQKELLVWRDSILQNSDAVEEDQSMNALVFLRHIFLKEKQEEKERLERIDLLHQQASAKNLNKTFY